MCKTPQYVDPRPLSSGFQSKKTLSDPLYSLKGIVVHGQGRGRTVGMPTANLQSEDETALPALGVYATLVFLDGRRYQGVTNVGQRPSVDEDAQITVETFILDFSQDIYGQPMELQFFAYLRPVEKFHSLAEVKAQVELDYRACRDFFA